MKVQSNKTFIFPWDNKNYSKKNVQSTNTSLTFSIHNLFNVLFLSLYKWVVDPQTREITLHIIDIMIMILQVE